MSKALVDFIKICLLDGEISEKERNGIFNKAKELVFQKKNVRSLLTRSQSNFVLSKLKK